MRGDEKRVVDAFCRWLEDQGWKCEHEVTFVDAVGERIYVEAKGRTAALGLDVDTLYGQLLRRMPIEDSEARFAVVVPSEALTAALRVPERVRELLRIDVYSVDAEGNVATHKLGEAGTCSAP